MLASGMLANMQSQYHSNGLSSPAVLVQILRYGGEHEFTEDDIACHLGSDHENSNGFIPNELTDLLRKGIISRFNV